MLWVRICLAMASHFKKDIRTVLLKSDPDQVQS
jgi:hypothetical protein